MSVPQLAPPNAGYAPYPQPYSPYPIMPPAHPPRRSHRTLWTVLGISTVLLILIGGVIGVVVVPRLIELAKPFDAAKAFCNDLVAQDYNAAYDVLTSDFQARLTRDQFVRDNRANDARDGRIQSCGAAIHGDISPSQISFDLGDTRAQFTYVFARTQQDFVGLITLVKAGDTWKLDALDASLLDLPSYSS
jgi:hypothetical protein